MPNLPEVPYQWQLFRSEATLRNGGSDGTDDFVDFVFAMRSTSTDGVELLGVGGKIYQLDPPLWIDFDS